MIVLYVCIYVGYNVHVQVFFIIFNYYIFCVCVFKLM